MIWPFKRKKKPTIEVKVEGLMPREALDLYAKRYPDLDRHFELTEMLRNTYTPSSDAAVEKGVQICRQMIAISPRVVKTWEQQNKDRAKAAKLSGKRDFKPWPLPNHLGFRQLAIILEKRGELEEAIAVARQAQAQGWNGDWEKRIARCEARIAKRGSSA